MVHRSTGTFHTKGIGCELDINYFKMILDERERPLICWRNSKKQNNYATVLNTNKQELSSIKIFPNPVKNILTIKNTEDIIIFYYMLISIKINF